jgi:RNA polymerase sigma factor (TIGR02999 family)
MVEISTGDVTRLLHQWQEGDRSSFDEASELIYDELHRIADRYLRSSSAPTLQPTALINEAYLRLAGVRAPIQGRKHFFALSARVMRQVLVDRARRHSAVRRGGGIAPEVLNEEIAGKRSGVEEFLVLDQALERLAQSEPRLARVVELHYYGGLTAAEISEVLDIPLWSVTRDHRLAEAWLRRALAQ